MTMTLVVGGGLIGMMTARELALNGEAVTLLEQGQTGRESSWAGGGILSPLMPWRYPDAVTALARWSQDRYGALAETLAKNTGIDPEWFQTGMLWLDTEEKVAALEWAKRHGSALEVQHGAEIDACEPALGAHGPDALWMANVANIRNPRLLQSVRADLLRLRVAVKEGVQVTGIHHSGGRITALETSRGEVSTGRAVIAGGAWSAGLLRTAGVDLPIRPVRGQMLLFRSEPGTVSRIVMGNGRYIIPRRDGHVLVGSTVEEVGFAKETTEEALEALRTVAFQLMPVLEDCPIERHWAGLRPGSPAGIPYIGEHPEVRGLYVNAGHYRNGVVLGLASVRLLADLMLGHDPILDASPYRLDREPERVDSV